MKFNEDLAAVHGYLCADGYVVRNLLHQKHKYYRAGLRNMNVVLLMDFQKRFKNYFGVSPKIYRNERCDMHSKEIYFILTKHYSYYSREWVLPKLPKRLMKYWLRAFFDCEGWVFVKSRQNRHIGADSVNHTGLRSIKLALEKLGISSLLKLIKARDISRLYIYGKNNLQRFHDAIGFLHPKKKQSLILALNSYMNYDWTIPKTEIALKKFIKTKLKVKKPFILRTTSIKKDNLVCLSEMIKKLFNIQSKVYGPWINGFGNPYYSLEINKKSEILFVLKENLLASKEKYKLSSNLFK